MKKRKIFLFTVRLCTIGILLGFFSILAIYFGVEEKSFLEKWWELATGGGLGMAFGFGVFLIVGTVGFVAGPAIYGSVGLATMLFGGVLGGLGLGSVINILRNPGNYNYNYLVLIPIGIVGLTCSYLISEYVGKIVKSRLDGISATSQ